MILGVRPPGGRLILVVTRKLEVVDGMGLERVSLVDDDIRHQCPQQMYSLNSEASILPRRMSAAAKRWRSS
jgi:hypothetical protein